MRTRNVSGLPPASDTGRCEVLLEFMGHVLTQTRHDIKAAESGLCLWRSDPDADGNAPKMPLRSDMNADESGEKRPNVRSKAWTEMAGRRQGPIHLAYTLVKDNRPRRPKKFSASLAHNIEKFLCSLLVLLFKCEKAFHREALKELAELTRGVTVHLFFLYNTTSPMAFKSALKSLYYPVLSRHLCRRSPHSGTNGEYGTRTSALLTNIGWSPFPDPAKFDCWQSRKYHKKCPKKLAVKAVALDSAVNVDTVVLALVVFLFHALIYLVFVVCLLRPKWLPLHRYLRRLIRYRRTHISHLRLDRAVKYGLSPTCVFLRSPATDVHYWTVPSSSLRTPSPPSLPHSSSSIPTPPLSALPFSWFEEDEGYNSDSRTDGMPELIEASDDESDDEDWLEEGTSKRREGKINDFKGQHSKFGENKVDQAFGLSAPGFSD
ncbi:hypothetical protein B0H14DRAFT_2612303 [Mycena olivaceomarginata]|nr:hypothetical protein B0H14DRAFT_2612303 [Mycena olivaceomarginata]